jgi:acyl carrier protein phosphodiesterase
MRRLPECIPVRDLLAILRLRPAAVIEPLADTVRPQYHRHAEELRRIDLMSLRFPYVKILRERFIPDFPAAKDLVNELRFDIPLDHFEHRKKNRILVPALPLMRRVVFNETVVDDTVFVFFNQFIKGIVY